MTAETTKRGDTKTNDGRRDKIQKQSLTAGPSTEQQSHQVARVAQQCADSQKLLCRLLHASNKKINFIHSERNQKEETRRIKEEAARQSLRSKLLKEAEDSSRKNASVAMKWADLFSIEVPQDLLRGIEDQKSQCLQIIKSKDALISDMKAQVLKKDDEYVVLLKRQSEETALLLDAMQAQETEMRAAYNTELKETEHAFLQERNELMETNKAELERACNRRTQLEQEYIDRFLETAEKYEDLLKEMRLGDIDEYNTLKAKLETDIQTLEQHLETMRATYQLNAEKLEYNYRVLVERDCENSATISQQKRKLSKQRDVLCGLKSRHAHMEKRFSSENQKLTEEYRRITEHFSELQKQQRKFETVERNELSKFNSLWEMKEERIFAMVRKLLNADRFIQETLLGWTWMPPNEAIFKFEAKSFGSDARSNLDSSTLGGSQDNGIDDEVRQYIDSGAYHSALSLICDEAGFLLDQKAIQLIESVAKNEQGYIKAEEVVQALGVRDASAFEALIEAIVSNSDETTEPLSDKGMSALEQSSNLVVPNEVLRRLKAFIENEIMPQMSVTSTSAKTKRRSTKASGLSRRILRKEAMFWERLSNSVSAEAFQLWKVLHSHLTAYWEMVQKRSESISEVKQLRDQNKQLRTLLNQYLSSKVNEELAVPPVQTL